MVAEEAMSSKEEDSGTDLKSSSIFLHDYVHTTFVFKQMTL